MPKRRRSSTVRLSTPLAGSRSSLMLAVAAAVGWSWAVALLAAKQHLVFSYHVIASAPPAWGFLAVPAWMLLAILISGIAAAGLCATAPARRGRMCSAATGWLLLSCIVPLLDIARAAGAPIPHTFLEPLLLVFVTGKVVEHLVRGRLQNGDVWPSASRIWLPIVTLLAIAAAAWWYHQGRSAYDEYLLGYHDFGHFARRVVNTWEGRGFLKESPSVPAFWDHFNPGLALLAPLWAAWPDAGLFILLQALCLALPAPILYGIARAWGATAPTAACWGAAYLAFPVVGQLNLNYSYGWHPVSLALPLMFVAVWALLRRRFVAAAIAAVLACSFKETVLVTTGCLAAVLAVERALSGRRFVAFRRARNDDQPIAAGTPLSSYLPLSAWIAVWATISIAFFLIYRLTPFAQFQTARFDHLGDSSLQIALSPLLRPRAFWEQIVRADSLYFLLTLFLPLGLGTLRRGWLILLAIAFPTLVLLAWDHRAATCIAFQYVTTLVPVLFLAALAGSARSYGALLPASTEDRSLPVQSRVQPFRSESIPDGRSERDAESVGAGGMLAFGAAALAACLTASVFFGALPWSGPTLTIMKAGSYLRDGEPFESHPRAAGTRGNRQLNQIVDRLNRPAHAVLASGRVAAHLLRVRRLESVEQAIVRWDDLEVEAGPGRAAVEVFDFVVLDTYECFQQSPDKMQFVAQQATLAGYRQTLAADGILVFERPR